METHVEAKLEVDRGLCMGSGLCAVTNPSLFGLDADGYGAALRTDLHSAEDVDAARDIASCCPAEAIVITARV
jgi:ferredoxin